MAGTITGIVLNQTAITTDAPVGTQIGTVTITLSDGTPFSGSLTLAGPYASYFQVVSTRDPYAITSVTLDNLLVPFGAASGTKVGTVIVVMSDGSAFAGTLSVNDTAHFTISGLDLVTATTLTGGTVYPITITAAEPNSTNRQLSTDLQVTAQAGGAVPGPLTQLLSPAQDSNSIVVTWAPPTTGGAMDSGVHQIQYKASTSSTWLSAISVPYITPGSGSFTDAAGNTWTVNTAGKPVINSTNIDTPSTVRILYKISGTIWQLDLNNAWYSTIGGIAPSWQGPFAVSPLTVTIGGLNASTTYNVQGYATNTAGTGASSAPISATTLAVSQTGGPGPAASSPWVTADFTNLTGRKVIPELFGYATGGLANDQGLSQSGRNGNWSDLAAYPQLRTLIRNLNIPLIRVNSLAVYGNDTFNGPYMLDNLLNNLASSFPPTVTIIYGIQCNTNNYQTYFNFAKAFTQYWKDHAPAGYRLKFMECMNETGLDANTYASCFSGMIDGAQSVDPTIRGTGPASAGYNGSQANAVINLYNATTGPQKLGFINHHQYMWCNGADAKPSDFTIMTAGPGPNNLPNVIQGQGNAYTSSWAANLPSYGLFEYSLECGASGQEDRTQTSRGACFLMSMVMKTAENTTWTAPWLALWDIYFDTGANYNSIYPNSNFDRGAQYYTMERMISRVPGNLCRVTNGNSGNMSAWATVNGSNFSVCFVNFSGSPQSGQVALSHWPVNTTGNGTAKFWAYPTTNGLSVPGVETLVNVTNGVVASVTVPANSIAVLST